MPRYKVPSRADFADQVRAEHLPAAEAASDEALGEWSERVAGEVREASAAHAQAKAAYAALAAAREAARLAKAHGGGTNEAWRAAVAAALVGHKASQEARLELHRLRALAEVLGGLLKARRGAQAAPRRRRGAAPVETCPFCEHEYTVRDGHASKTDAEGNALQLRKCQCRAMTPPCKHCPTCKAHAPLLAAEGDAQVALCRDQLRCDICACQCPGAGKWVEGDAESRAAFRERSARRDAQLSSLLQTSWGGDGGAAASDSDGPAALALPPRLPADIKEQVEAAVSMLAWLPGGGGEAGRGGDGGGGAAATAAAAPPPRLGRADRLKRRAHAQGGRFAEEDGEDESGGGCDGSGFGACRATTPAPSAGAPAAGAPPAESRDAAAPHGPPPAAPPVILPVLGPPPRAAGA
jgi:hypothetical protein